MREIRLVDTHCHLDNEKFDSDRPEVIERIKNRLEFCVNIGYDLKSSKKSLQLAKELERIAKDPRVVAIGEIGLDYHWMTQPKEVQENGFRRQLELAKSVNKPVVIHTRDAMEDTIKILKEYPEIGGVLHCYPGSLETAKLLIDRFYLGIGGTLTFKNSKKTVEVVKDIPLDRIVIETDCPYLTPEPFRGKRNEPIYVEYVAQKIAEIKNISVEEVVKATTENAKKLYNIG